MPGPPRHVLYVNDHLGWGNQVHGVTRLFELWATHLDPARYRGSVCIVRRRQPELAEGLRRRGVPVTFLGKARYDPTALLSLLGVVRREGIGLLHVQGYGATSFGRLVGAIARIPVVVHFHDTTPYYPWPQKLADRLLGPLTDRYLAVSRTVRDWWARRCRLEPDAVLVLPNCTSLERFHVPAAGDAAAARGRLGIAPGAPVIGTVTRLFEEKGTRYLIEAAPRILAERRDARFVIVGDGPLRPELERLAAQTGLGDRVVFTGYAEDVSAHLAAFDVFVLTSQFAEGGVPLPVLEAMATGKPVVVTDAVEIVEDGVAGFVIPRRDPEAIAARVLQLIARPEQAARMAAAALVAVEAHDVGAYMRRLQAVYDSLLG